MRAGLLLALPLALALAVHSRSDDGDTAPGLVAWRHDRAATGGALVDTDGATDAPTADARTTDAETLVEPDGRVVAALADVTRAGVAFDQLEAEAGLAAQRGTALVAQAGILPEKGQTVKAIIDMEGPRHGNVLPFKTNDQFVVGETSWRDISTDELDVSTARDGSKKVLKFFVPVKRRRADEEVWTDMPVDGDTVKLVPMGLEKARWMKVVDPSTVPTRDTKYYGNLTSEICKQCDPTGEARWQEQQDDDWFGFTPGHCIGDVGPTPGAHEFYRPGGYDVACKCFYMVRGWSGVYLPGQFPDDNQGCPPPCNPKCPDGQIERNGKDDWDPERDLTKPADLIPAGLF